MKNLLFILFGATCFLSFIYTINKGFDYEVKDDFKMVIKGTSNVHDWESTIESMEGYANIEFNGEDIIQIHECQIQIPVNSIKSSKGKRMDKKTMKALKEEEYPTINFNLKNSVKINTTDQRFQASAIGNLSLAGVTKSIELDLNGKVLEDGKLEIQGSKALKMTDFDIKPPTALLGTMRTGDDITIEYKIILDKPSS